MTKEQEIEAIQIELELRRRAQEQPVPQEQVSQGEVPFGTQAALLATRAIVKANEATPTALRVAPSVASFVLSKTGLVGSAIGAGLEASSETAAEALEMSRGQRPEGINPREIGAAAIIGATPMAKKGIGRISSMLSNATLATTFNELSKFVETGGVEKPKTITDWISRAAPAVFSGTAALAAKQGGEVVKSHEKIKELSKERFGGGVLISEVVGDLKLAPSIRKSEARAIQRGNQKAVELYNSTGMNLGDAVTEAFKNSPDAAKIANSLAPHIGEIDRLQSIAARSSAEAQSLADAAAKAAQEGSVAAKQIMHDARVASVKAFADKATHDAMLNKVFGAGVPSLSGVSQGSRELAMAEAGNAAFNARKVITDSLYDASGISINTPVVSRSDINEFADLIKGNEARKSFIGQMDSLFGDSDTITREVFLEAKNKIADNLVSAGAERGIASKKAGEMYSVLKNASERFIAREIPESADAYKNANKAFSTVIGSESSDVLNMIRSGDAAGIASLIKKEGAGKTLSQIEEYASALKKIGGESSSQKFTKDIYTGIRDAVFDSATNRTSGFVSASKTFDPQKIAEELMSLHSKGFPIEALGMGSISEVRSMAKLASTGTKGGYTYKDLNAIMNELPSVGIDKAIAKVEYDAILKKQLIEGGFYENKAKIAERARAAQKAGLDSASAQSKLNDALNDPLIKLLNSTDLNISRDVAKNAEWASSLLSLDPSVIRSFTDVMGASGRAGQVDEIGKAAAKSVMFNFSKMRTAGSSNLNSAAIADFFNNPKNEKQLSNLKTLMGKESFDNLRKTFVAPIERMQAGLMAVEPKEVIDVGAAQTAAFARQLAAGKKTGDIIFVNAYKRALDFMDNKYYNTLHLLYIDPKWSKKFASAGYNLDKFSSASPVNATAIKLVNALDEQDNQQEKSPQ